MRFDLERLEDTDAQARKDRRERNRRRERENKRLAERRQERRARLRDKSATLIDAMCMGERFA